MSHPLSSKYVVRLGVVACVLLFVLAACGAGENGPVANNTNGSSGTSSSQKTPTAPSAGLAQFVVTRVDMSVSPSSIDGTHCGANATITYTATFHVVANSPGGTVQFGFTINNGRGESMTSLTFAPGQTAMTYTFTWSGALPGDHTYPGLGGVDVTSPNQLLSELVMSAGQCS
ncbi:MAG TPA: hypothetical protein VGT44_20900 [Ktedonobacteraceae bacterium]|nr:hypothetical protein [Ktedonobacteraceae bacterium]